MSKESEADHVQLQYVNEEDMWVVVGPSHHENFSSQKEKAKSKLSRRTKLLKLMIAPKNHTASSKAMEPASAVEMFSNAPNKV